jgi:hypothetical protein
MTRDLLLRRREAIKADLLLKFEVGDWHGVQDCASDIREIEAMLPLVAKPDPLKGVGFRLGVDTCPTCHTTGQFDCPTCGIYTWPRP